MSHRTTPPSPPGREPKRHPADRRGINHQPVNWLLVIPLIGTLVPMFYNFTSPRLGGIPFFYWYQMVWIPISVVLTWIVFVKTRNER